MPDDTKTKHDLLVQNLEMFIKHLLQTRIKFIFFNADNMDKPLLATSFGKHKEWFIIPGKHKNYCYAYTKSNLVYMVSHLRIKQKGTIILYNVKLNQIDKKTKTNDIAYLGNHIDFSIHKSHNDVFFSVHLTDYIERDQYENSFDRRITTDCNFITPTLKSFGKTSCLDRKNIHLFQLDRMIPEKNKHAIIEDLWRASNGILTKKHQGGAPRQPEWYKSYKGVDTVCPEFYAFINRSIFEHLWKKLRHLPQYVYQYFDEGNELDPITGNKSIQYVIEFEEQWTIAFAISSHRALKACWTEMNMDVASIREKRAFTHWKQQCVKFLANNFYA